jgi:pimeloyl-ACP methyl ester carboxylesterase
MHHRATDALYIVDALDGETAYDEFGLLHENAAEWDLPHDPALVVRRGAVEVDAGAWLSYLRWGTEEPEVVFLHGGGQNAHTWDTAILALDRPAIAVDLPGHGHSFRRADRNYGPWANAEAVAAAISLVAPSAVAVVGMSLGGATTIRLAAERPDLCPHVVLIDVTPQINDPSREMSTVERGSVALIGGPPTYASLEEMADAAVALSPFRAPEGVRRGVRHNSYRRPDGSWTWRYDLFGPTPAAEVGPITWADFSPLWDDVERITQPLMFVRGGLSKYVRDEDVEELRRRVPSARVEVVDGAGHAVQSDQPLELVRLLREFLPA